jgi:four helix bundle protein
MSNGNITHFSFKTNNKMKNIILEKTEEFGKKISRLNIYLIKEKHEYTRSDQILRSGTSIGANVTEGTYAQSHADFISKMSIAFKEAQETKYWLNILYDSQFITTDEYTSLLNDNMDIIRILSSILKSAKNKSEKK